MYVFWFQSKTNKHVCPFSGEKMLFAHTIKTSSRLFDLWRNEQKPCEYWIHINKLCVPVQQAIPVDTCASTKLPHAGIVFVYEVWTSQLVLVFHFHLNGGWDEKVSMCFNVEVISDISAKCKSPDHVSTSLTGGFQMRRCL